jgi:cytochrome c556
MNTPTPRTDALYEKDKYTATSRVYGNMHEHAIQLERELDEARELAGPISLDLISKLKAERDEAREQRDALAERDKRDDRWTIEAFKAVTNTLMSGLIRKWEAESERCGEEGRNSDEEWNDDGDEWRERRSVYFECAEELKAALRKYPKHNATVKGEQP